MTVTDPNTLEARYETAVGLGHITVAAELAAVLATVAPEFMRPYWRRRAADLAVQSYALPL